jgi:hypothetical protein
MQQTLVQSKKIFDKIPPLMILYRVFSKLRRSLQHEILYIILKNFSLNLLSKMFVLTEIIDRIFS